MAVLRFDLHGFAQPSGYFRRPKNSPFEQPLHAYTIVNIFRTHEIINNNSNESIIEIMNICLLILYYISLFQIAVGLARLIKYFSVSPLGSLVIRDFQLIQFVTMNDEIKLSDLDDTGNEGHPCHSNHDCIIGNQTYNITLPCINNFCRDYNEKWNLYNLERVYFKMFLLPGAPEHVRKDLEDIEGHAELLKYNSKDLVRDLEKVLGKLRNGQELGTICLTLHFGLFKLPIIPILRVISFGFSRKNVSSRPLNDHLLFTSGKYRSRYQYKAIPRADFPGCHDYECDHSTSSVNCQSLAYNEVEAMRQCDDDMECKAFVMSYGKTWIGNWH